MKWNSERIHKSIFVKEDKIMRQKIYFSFFFLLSIPIMDTSCSSGAGGQKQTAANSSTTVSNEEDDLEVVEPVPMALIAGDFVNQVRKKMGSAIAQGSYNDVKDDSASRKGTDSNSEDNLELSLNILDAPGLAAGQMKELLNSIQELMSDIFGKEGFFKAKKISVPIDTKLGYGKKIYKVNSAADAYATKPEFAIIYHYDETKETYPFIVELYTRTALGGSEFERTTRIEFAGPVGTTEEKSKVHLLHSSAPESDTSRQYLEATYAMEDKKISATFGDLPVSESVPSKNILDFSFDDASSTIMGAYTWTRTAIDTSGMLIPEYYVLNSGDVELFRAISSSDGNEETVQDVSFLPKSKIATATSSDACLINSYKPGNCIFEYDYSYLHYMMKFLVNLVRKSAINNSCSVSGDAFRSGFSGAANTPTSVQNVSNNMCESNTSLADSAVASVIMDTCDAGVNIIVPVHLSGSGGSTTNFSLCKKYLEGVILLNSQFIQASSSGRELQLPETSGSIDLTKIRTRTPPTDTYSSLKSTLEAKTFIDYSTLKDTSLFTIPTSGEADFKDAIEKI